MRDLIHSIANNRGLYAVLILLNAPGWAAYSAVSYGLNLPPAIEHSPYYMVAGVTILALDALVILAYVLHLVLALVEYLMDR
jgi:hypothetical protein